MKIEVTKGADHDVHVIGDASGVFVVANAHLPFITSENKIDLELVLRKLADKIPGPLDNKVIDMLIAAAKM